MSSDPTSESSLILWVPQHNNESHVLTARKASEKIDLDSPENLPHIELNKVIHFILFRKPDFIIPPFPDPSEPTDIPSIVEEGREQDVRYEGDEADGAIRMEVLDEDDDLDFTVCEEVHGDSFMDVDQPEHHANKRKSSDADGDVFKPVMKRKKDRGAEQVDPQWRVGKTPGHQGSHRKDLDKLNGEVAVGEKRSISQSINETAKQVLKKPFRPPKIVLPRAKPKPTTRLASSSPPAELSSMSSYQVPTSPRSLPARLQNRVPPNQASRSYLMQSSPTQGESDHTGYPSDFPIFESTPPNHRSSKMSRIKLTKPFKTPNKVQDSDDHLQTPSSTIFSRSGAPSPSSFPSRKTANHPGITLSRSTQPSAPHQTDRSMINSLELRAQHLREALNYYKNPGIAYEIVQLTQQWLAAGREITERMFQLIPRPDPTESIITPNTHRNQSYYGDMGGMNGDMELSGADREYLDSLPRNEDGEAVDAEGNLLIGGASNMIDLLSIMKEEAELAKGRKGLSSGGGGGSVGYPRMTRDSDGDGDFVMGDATRYTPNPVDPNVWDHGALLGKFGIDPALFRWDAQAEDWIDLEEI